MNLDLDRFLSLDKTTEDVYFETYNKEDGIYYILDRDVFAVNYKRPILTPLTETEKKTKRVAVDKKRYQKDKEKLNKYAKEYYSKNKEELLVKYKKYVKKNRIKINSQFVKKRNESPLFKLSWYCRIRVLKAFKGKGWKKNSKTQDLMGVSYETAKQHIERQFTKGMNWSNYGKWHIDHKIPLASAKTEKELIDLCHYTNLQPLWAKENLQKSDKILAFQITLTI